MLPQKTLMGLNGLEPSTSRLSGVRSNQLSYRPIYGAGEGNRTLDNSLEGCGFTTKLHPQKMAGLAGFEPTNDGVKVRCLTAWL